MKKIESFTVDHTVLKEGIYTSRKDWKDGVCVTTFDLRMTKPNIAPAMEISAIHAIEHLVATFLRNSERKSEVVYFGPMGCRTGFYLIMFGDLSPMDVASLVFEAMEFIANFQGDIPGASEVECGNFRDLNLEIAKFYAREYLEELKAKRYEYL